ncbi:RagB/SusD family nutrient uptake outer membrane protein [Pedobacter ginsengisoli]|uniref:RagB/SusD family nutrient uptake outer membrane protein n=1 Tax=Pedobacter ginsengisoli TaxID=363852 RepID=A0A2D1U0W8_9SPHI|nr:RagB/SusD family nutrient uptake outer membrane protein [Pedobacter ginsengisoli]ATP55272.1 RagB/SusD family nutrient uptake outer membrane protein [Pedobacter ginsengisoli]
MILSRKNKSIRKIRDKWFLILFLIIALSGCKKWVEVPPPVTSLTGESVFKVDATAAAVLTNLYARMGSYSSIGSYKSSVSYLLGLSADEFVLTSFGSELENDYYKNRLRANIVGGEFWGEFYNYIFICNSAIEGIEKSNDLSKGVKEQLLGEAKFLRAFCYFYLVNIYDDVPKILTTDYKENSVLARSPVPEVYKQIISDLMKAREGLTDGYVKSDAETKYTIGSEERIRPNKWAAIALLARVCLYTKDYINAEILSTQIINQTALYNVKDVPLVNVFLKNSKESIWQVQPIQKSPGNTGDAFLFVIPGSGFSENNPVYLSEDLLNKFEVLDERKFAWVNIFSTGNGNNCYYACKYKIADITSNTKEYVTVLRLAEQYLIRAEARAYQDDLEGAREDLNVVRNRAGLENTLANDRKSILKAIINERQLELFTEWGHRWLDIKRTAGFENSSVSLADEIMPAICTSKGGLWTPNAKLFPIVLGDIQNNPNLIQNTGY